MKHIFRSKIYTAVALLVSVLLVGTMGFKWLEDFTWLDSLYMTVITMTTVGFSEVSPLDTSGRIFTIALILYSVLVLGYSISIITEYIMGRNSLQILKRKKVKSKIKDLKEHVIVCGFGRNGMQAAERLTAFNRPFVVIERNKEIVEKYEEEILFVEGDANEDEVLYEAGIDRASYLITAMPDDAANLFVVLSARQLNQKLFIISRASQVGSFKKLQLAGANKVIMPDRIGGDHMASLVVNPDLITFMDNLSTDGHTTNLEEVAIEALEDKLENASIRGLDLRRKTGCTIIGYVTPEGEYIINPEPELTLLPGSKVIVLGRPEQIQKLNKMFHIDPTEV
ncbi:potassium channel family protein [Sediminicola luteus]|uniref:Potassium channel protein n=1 Tax=Sediminicola luteus TaxID=319238 RepID=A0A2A4G4B5_9FLAO|nr:potassium channel protein [Sediminicola luteus]PCE63507.1 potassium channel protein [Sediminicola luteus]